MSHHPPLHPDESEPIALNPLLRGVDLAIDRLIRRNCFTGRTLDILDELREELLAVSSDTRPQGNPEMTPDDLRKIAEAATKGPWEAVTDGKPDFYGLPEWRIGNPAYPPVARAGMTRANAEFISTFNPQRVLELLDENVKLRVQAEIAEHDRKLAWRDMDKTRARLAAVEQVHIRREYWTETGDDICDTCSRRKQNDFAYWPCDTIKAARGE